MMKQRKCIVLSLWFLCCAVQVQAANLQYRSGIGVSKEVSPDWKMTFNDGIRFLNGENDLYYNESDLGLVYGGAAPWLDISFNMKWATQEDDDGHWQQEVRPHLNFTVKQTFLGMTIKDTTRIEYRELESDPDAWRFRNKIMAEMPWTLSPLELKPYVGDEVWFRLDGTGFYKNRVITGVTMPITSRVKGDFYYYWDKTTDDTDPGWAEQNVFGFKLKIEL